MTMGGMTNVRAGEMPYRKIWSASTIGLGTNPTPSAQLTTRKADDHSARFCSGMVSSEMSVHSATAVGRNKQSSSRHGVRGRWAALFSGDFGKLHGIMHSLVGACDTMDSVYAHARPELGISFV